LDRKQKTTGEILVPTHSGSQNGGNKEKRKPTVKIERSEFEEDLQITGKNDLNTVVRHRKEWRQIVLENRVHNRV